jgi:hypothetical protein
MFRLVLACALLAACSRNADAGDPLPGGGYSYLVTPAGRMYRILRMGPMIGAEGKKLGTVVSYAGETREMARITRDARELVSALGPEMEVSGETAIIVQVNVGYDPRRTISHHVAYNVVFDRQAGRGWGRLPPKADEPKEIGGIDGSAQPPDDPSFPFDPAKASGAARAAARWVALIDAANLDESVAAMSASFRSQLSLDTWRGFVVQRSAIAAGASRVELYRMQTRNANVPIPPGGGAVVEYELRSSQGRRFVERVTLLNEKDGWRPAGYALQAIPPL